MKYRKKPVVIEAMQYDGTLMGLHECVLFCGKLVKHEDSWCIETLEGFMKISKGDYIIKGVHGEFYPCKPDIFEETYELVGE